MEREAVIFARDASTTITLRFELRIRSSLRLRLFICPTHIRGCPSPRLLADIFKDRQQHTFFDHKMEITDLFFARREESLLSGDHNTYRAQTSRRLHIVRKKLRRTTPKGRKYSTEAPITSEDVASNPQYVVFLALMTFSTIAMTKCP
jgi:RNA-binding signal recognition particle 68